jgi:hypothetical protein
MPEPFGSSRTRVHRAATPVDVHRGTATAISAKRQAVLDHAARPERFGAASLRIRLTHRRLDQPAHHRHRDHDRDRVGGSVIGRQRSQTR